MKDMKLVIPFADPEFVMGDIAVWVEEHSKGATIDGDREVITIDEPDEKFLNELKRRGISWGEE